MQTAPKIPSGASLILLVGLAGVMGGCGGGDPSAGHRGGRQLAWSWLAKCPVDAYKARIRAMLGAENVAYLAPRDTPYDDTPNLRGQLLDGHKSGWEYVVRQVNPAHLGPDWFEHVWSSCCEASEPYTVGWYAGQRDAKWLLQQIATSGRTLDTLVCELKRIQGGDR
jgi:hypothetical protein